MNYIYDILLNFQDEYYDFFEWNPNDKITHIKKAPIIKISNEDLTTIREYEIKFSDEFLKQIYNKTQIFKKYDINIVNYICIFCSDKETIGVKMNKNGIVTGKSSLLLDENDEILEVSENMEITRINVWPHHKIKTPKFHTRKEIVESKETIKKLQHLFKNGEENKLNYLFFECFGKKETDINKAFNKIKNEVYKYNDNYNKINDFLKIISQK